MPHIERPRDAFGTSAAAYERWSRATAGLRDAAAALLTSTLRVAAAATALEHAAGQLLGATAELVPQRKDARPR